MNEVYNCKSLIDYTQCVNTGYSLLKNPASLSRRSGRTLLKYPTCFILCKTPEILWEPGLPRPCQYSLSRELPCSLWQSQKTLRLASYSFCPTTHRRYLQALCPPSSSDQQRMRVSALQMNG